MTIVINPGNATKVLLAGAGWQDIEPGTLAIAALEIQGTPTDPETEDYGFVCTTPTGGTMVGSITALLAIEQ